ncbi:MAG: adenylate/guanylate cyclase domain-containing protein [Actinomycetota bacterium]
MSQLLDESLEAGREAMSRNAWREGYELLRESDLGRPLEPPDLELLGEAAWWIGRADDCIDYHERAYTGYLNAGNPKRAGFMALLLVRHYFGKSAPSVAMGWFSHAERLLSNELDCVEHGYLAQMRVTMFQEANDLGGALDQAELSLEIGMRFADRTLQGYALLDKGRILVASGRVQEGLKYLDEATVAAVSGEVQPIAAGIIYCRAIGACAELSDYRRAGEFTEAARRWCDRLAIAGGFPGVCRVHRAEIIRLRGDWAEAEREARVAADELGGYMPSIAAEAFHEIGELKLRMGDLPAAEEAFSQAHELLREPQPGLSLLRLEEGKVATALNQITASLSAATQPLRRAKLLPATVRIAIAAGDIETARAAAEELGKIAHEFGTALLLAGAEFARGQIQLVDGDYRGSVSCLRRSLQHWREADAPYEAAVVRLTMAEALRQMGDEDSAIMELRSAKATFDRLGAIIDGRRALQMLGDAGDGRGRSTPQVTRTFMFTDIVKSTNLVEALGDEAWEDLQRWHDSTLRSLFAANGGHEVKQVGDGFLVAFEKSQQAIESAVAIQKKLAEHRRSHGFAPQVRIGIHETQATVKGLDYGGKGVHEAARIGALAEGGEILSSRSTLASASCRYPMGESRSVTLKGIKEPVEVATIAWR